MNFKNGLIAYYVDTIRKEFNFIDNFENEDLSILVDCKQDYDGSIIKISVCPKIKLEIITFYIQMDQKIVGDNSVYLNGYQTWTNSREFKIKESIARLRKIAWPIMSVYGDYGFYTTNRNKLQSYTYTYIRGQNNIKLFGSLSEKSGYTIFEYIKNEQSLRVSKDCSGLIIDKEYEVFELFIIEGEENYTFDRYFDAMKLKKPRMKPCTGWTSWYNYYTKVNEKIVLDNLKAFRSREIPIEFFQIDDGYQQALGDWLQINNKFPSGMKYVATEIKKAGYRAGIWLAPFVCDKKSQIYKEHPQWVLGKAGFNPGWNGFFNILDFYNEEFREYLRKVFHTILNEWNYDMVKLDFLYAAALIKRRDKTRGQVMYEAMEFLRELVGDKLILGCGVPLGCAFGLTDYCRIGSDVSLFWEDRLLNGLNYRERVSTRNSLDSTIGRRHLNGRAFMNDPDVFILRSNNNRLTTHQKYTLFLFNLIFGGLVFTSDNLEEYTEEEMKLYKSIFPIREKTIKSVILSEIVKVYFIIDNNEYLMLSNLYNKHATEVILNEGNYYNKEKGLLHNSSMITLKPYESICLIKTASANSKLLKSSNIFML